MPGPEISPEEKARRTVEAVWRIESPRLLGALVRMLRDVDLAEELAQEALLAALEHWPVEGTPDNPGAWLMTTAKRRGIDRLRRHALQHEREAEIARALEDAPEEMHEREQMHLDEDIEDDLLRLMFIACHPVLPPEPQVARTLRIPGGLTNGGNRPRLPDARSHHRATHRARQALTGAGPRAFRNAARRSARSAP